MQLPDSSPKDPFEESFLETLRKSDLADIVQDVAELGLDSLLVNGPFRDLPLIGSIVASGKTVAAIRDWFLLRKVAKFLQRLASVPLEERRSMADQIKEDKGYGQRIAESIVVYLDRYDHLNKAELLSRMFIAYTRGELQREEFIRLASAIDTAFIHDLELINQYYSLEDPDQVDLGDTKRTVFNSGLSSFYVLTHHEWRRSGAEHPQVYHFNQLAMKFAKAALGDSFHGDRW